MAIKSSMLNVGSCLYRDKLNTDFTEEVLNRLSNDRPGNVCRIDSSLISVGYRIWERTGECHRPREVIRLLARVICQLQDDIGDVSIDLRAALNSPIFYELELAINSMCRKETDDESAGSDSLKHGLKLNIAYALKDAAEILKCIFLVKGDTEGFATTEGFLNILKLEWSSMFRKSIKKMISNRFEKSRRPVHGTLREIALFCR